MFTTVWNQKVLFNGLRKGSIVGNQCDGNALIAKIQNLESSLEEGRNTTLSCVSATVKIHGLPFSSGLFDPLPLLSDKAQFYLMLNSLGRKKFLGLPDPKLWLDTIIKHKEDHSVTFALLSMNPSLCNCNSLSLIGETSKPEHPPKRRKLAV